MNRRVMVSVALVILGGTLLLVTTGVVTIGAIILPVVFLISGIALFWRAFLPGGKDANVFTGTFLGLTGAFSLLLESALPGVNSATVWPVFMTIIGIALGAYGVRKGNDFRFTLVTPGVAIVLLSFVFLLFSTDVIEISLGRVALTWWPVIIVLVGVLLLFYGRDWGDGDDADEGDPELDEDLLPPRIRAKGDAPPSHKSGNPRHN